MTQLSSEEGPPPISEAKTRQAPPARQLLDRALFAIAITICLLFIGGLTDTRLVWPSGQAPNGLAELDQTAEAFDARLAIQLADGKTCQAEGLQPQPAGGSEDAGASSAAAVAPSSAPTRATRPNEPAQRDCSRAQGISGATVSIWLVRDNQYYLVSQGVTEKDGLHNANHLPRGNVWVIASAPGFARGAAYTSVTEPDPGNTIPQIQIVLEPAHSLLVRVKDEAGAPIHDATLLINDRGPLPHGGLTSRAGEHQFESLAAGPWKVKASAPGFESANETTSGSELSLTLRRLGSLTVRVLEPSGGPAASATVFIAGSGLWPARQTRTDSRGLARISGLLSGTYDIRAEKNGAISQVWSGHRLAKSEHSELTLQLRAGRMIPIWVTSEVGGSVQAIPNADVVLTEFGLSTFPLQGKTNSEGQLTLGPISPGPASISARATGFVARSGVAVPSELDGRVEVRLLAGARLTGLVTDPAGNPVAGASIEVIGTDTSGMPLAETPQLTAFRDAHFAWALPGPTQLIPAGELGVMPGPIPPIPKAWSSLAGLKGGLADDGRRQDYMPWVSGHHGQFNAFPVTPGRVRALVRHPDYVEGLSDSVQLSPGGTAEVRVVLAIGGSLAGQLNDAEGYPVAGARVDLVALSGSSERTALTAQDGSFAFKAAPEKVMLIVYHPDNPDRIALQENVTILSERQTELTLQLPPRREKVLVRVETETGEPVELAQISALSLDPKYPLRSTFFSDARGELELQDTRGLRLQLLVSAPGYSRSEKSYPSAQETITVVLASAVTITGQITAVRGRQAVAGANVRVSYAGEQRSVLTDQNGEYELRDITPGPLRVHVSHPDYAPAERSVLVQRTGRDDRPFELEPIDLVIPGEIEGEVVDREGNPVAGARVAIGVVPAYLPVGRLPADIALTDQRGQFQLKNIPSGETELEAYLADIGRGRARVDILEGRTTSGVRIVLDEPSGDPEPAASGSVAITLTERVVGREAEVIVSHIVSGGEAERAGLQLGDRLIRIDDSAVAGLREARLKLSGPVRTDVVVVVLRRGERLTLRIRREAVQR